jgi:hypothetical protein
MKAGEEKLSFLKSFEGQIGVALDILQQVERSIEMWTG